MPFVYRKACDICGQQLAAGICRSSFPKIVKEGWDGDKNEGYVTNLRDSATVGFKYFDLKGVSKLVLFVRGYAYGSMEIRCCYNGPLIQVLPLHYSNIWAEFVTEITFPENADTLYFTYRGEGNASMKGFSLA